LGKIDQEQRNTISKLDRIKKEVGVLQRDWNQELQEDQQEIQQRKQAVAPANNNRVQNEKVQNNQPESNNSEQNNAKVLPQPKPAPQNEQK
jgi:tRNA U34 5-carboxymethylaminomethyl modifying enzyme MnmG/GidA